MKFIYIDESGKEENSPYDVLCGISFDHTRMRKTKSEWLDFIQLLNNQGVTTSEFHTANFFAGRGVWYTLKSNKRNAIIKAIIGWLEDRSHEFCIVAANKRDYKKKDKAEALFSKNIWSFLATHLIFAFSKRYQQEKSSKGNFVTIFDNGCVGTEFNKFILSENAKILFQEYLGKRGIIKLSDAPFSADSKHSSLIQIADFIVFFIRRKIDLENGCVEKYTNEKRDIGLIYNKLIRNEIEKRNIYKKSNRSAIEDLFFELAPEVIKK